MKNQKNFATGKAIALLASILVLVLLFTGAIAENAAAYLKEKNKEAHARILPQYEEMYAKNPDFVGWLRIDGTVIDYPIMYTPDEPHKYIDKDFEGNADKRGLLFIDENCALDSDNIIIHGHNMNDESMFGTLQKYEKESYWKKHLTIQFDMLYKEQEYEVMFAFFDRVYYTHETCFKFYQFINPLDEADFEKCDEELS